MDQKQTGAPVLESIAAFHELNRLPFTAPGHKTGHGVAADTLEVLGSDVFRNDISELAGLDDRHKSFGVRKKAEQLAAEAHGADQTLFSTNGSSLSVHTALLTVAARGDKVVIARNIHKSAIAGILMSGVDPVWVQPPVDPDWGIQHAPTPGQIKEALDLNPDVVAVFVVSPSTYGTVADVEAIASVCHQRGIPLLVDEAWGPHFPFNSKLPRAALHCGADMSINSYHKMLPCLSQASIINVKGDLIDKERFSIVFDLFETTAPSSLIFASMDGARRQMVRDGEVLWDLVYKVHEYIRTSLSEYPELRVMGDEVCEREEVVGIDPGKLNIDVSGLGLTGMQACDWLEQHCHICAELGDTRIMQLVLTNGDNEETADRFLAGMRELVNWARQNPSRPPVQPRPADQRLPEQVTNPVKAFFGESKNVRLQDAEGQIAAEMISPYPPGIPAIGPGERFTRPIIDFLQMTKEMGFPFPDSADPSLEMVRVVA